jgi:hypothetical protein
MGIVGKKVSKRSAIAGLAVSLLLLALLAACGGGSSSTPIQVNVTPATTAQLWPTVTGWPTQTQQFTANVTGTSNTAVTWAVTGGAANGTVDSTGLYTAPPLPVPNPATVTITATSSADSTKSGSGRVNIQTPTTQTTFTVTVTATEASTQHSQPVTLVVQ